MSRNPNDLYLGMRALARGLLSPTQLQQAIIDHARKMDMTGPSSPSFALLLISGGYLTGDQLATLLVDDMPPVQRASPKEVAPPVNPSAVRKFGKYSILRELGRGSMGGLVEALDTTLSRKVAIKRPFLRRHVGTINAGDEERFLLESSIAALLPRHPHLVEFYEAGRIEGQCYLAMELLEGRTMSEWRKTATLRQELDTILQIADGVHHAHEYGVIHRDLKPDNVMIRADRRAVLTDFGLSLSTSPAQRPSLTPAGFVVGSPSYMSPEQARGLKNIDRRTDIYSLGVLLYQALTGRKPFEGRSAMEILLRMMQDPVRRPSEIMRAGLNPVLYQALENVCLKALQREPRDRHPTAKAFAEHLIHSLGNNCEAVLAAEFASR